MVGDGGGQWCVMVVVSGSGRRLKCGLFYLFER